MSCVSGEAVKVVAQSLGLDDLRDELAEDIAPEAEYTLRTVVQEALKFMKHGKRSVLRPVDINHALRMMNLDLARGLSSSEPLLFEELDEPGVFAVCDASERLVDVATAPAPPAPLQASLAIHWLAVNGSQPAIPENPARTTSPRPLKRAKRQSKSPSGADQLKPPVNHVLSAEMHAYFSSVVAAVRTNDETVEPVLSTLANNAGVHQLVPYLCHYVAEEVNANVKNLSILAVLLRVVGALIANKHLNSQLELYLHQLMPALLTCVVGKRLCASPEADNHWALRSHAAELVAEICRRYGALYETLQPRVTKTLYAAFIDKRKPLTTQYGAIIAISALGPKVFDTLLLPRCPKHIARLERIIDTTSNSLQRFEAYHCKRALMSAVARYLKHGRSTAVQVVPNSIVFSLRRGAAAQASKRRAAQQQALDRTLAHIRSAKRKGKQRLVTIARPARPKAKAAATSGGGGAGGGAGAGAGAGSGSAAASSAAAGGSSTSGTNALPSVAQDAGAIPAEAVSLGASMQEVIGEPLLPLMMGASSWADDVIV